MSASLDVFLRCTEAYKTVPLIMYKKCKTMHLTFNLISVIHHQNHIACQGMLTEDRLSFYFIFVCKAMSASIVVALVSQYIF